MKSKSFRNPAFPVLPLFLIAVSLSSAPALFAQQKSLYENNFEKVETGKVPDDFLVLDGGFTVKEESGNKFLELPGSPLDSFAAQFGPTETSDLSVTARINASAKGRRYPTFGVGLNGVAGYKLQVSPGKKLVELLKDQVVIASVPYEWRSGQWLNVRLQIRETKPAGWKIEGKLWPKEAPEPATWMLSANEKEQPLAGRPSLFGSPFSGTPIQYDDLRVDRSIVQPE